MSVKNIRKSIKDYTIYFLTLILGVAIFYMFNSLDSQEAMLVVNSSTRQIVKLMVGMINYVSVFVAVILGFLIVYANNFLIKRRKREFGLYMTLGMGKRQTSRGNVSDRSDLACGGAGDRRIRISADVNSGCETVPGGYE